MTRKQLLEEATKCVLHDRNATHGEPEDNFRTIATYWTEYLRAAGVLQEDTRVRSEDVAALMVLHKVSRLATSPEKPDHWIDIAGYAACGGECATKERDDDGWKQRAYKPCPDCGGPAVKLEGIAEGLYNCTKCQHNVRIP